MASASSYFSPRYLRTVWPLAVAQTLFWACVYYVFPAMLPRWEAIPDWSRAELTGAFTVSLVISALAAPFAGTLIDRGLGPRNMIGGACVGALLLLILSQVQTLPGFYAVWIVMGFVQAVCLYEPCFAILTRLFAEDAKRAITVVTLIAGLAGTVSFPLAHVLAENLGWRQALMVFAAIMLIAAFVAHLSLRHETITENAAANVPRTPGRLARVMRQPTFWLLAFGFSFGAMNHGALLSHLLLILDERHIAAGTAVLAASMIGPMQVVGRLGMMGIERRGFSLTGVGVLSFSFVICASVCLYFSSVWPMLIIPFVILQGSGYGVTSIVRPSVTANFLGREGFGAISGAMALFFVLGFASAPTLASLLWERGGYDIVIIATAVASVTGLILFLAATRFRARTDNDD